MVSDMSSHALHIASEEYDNPLLSGNVQLPLGQLMLINDEALAGGLNTPTYIAAFMLDGRSPIAFVVS